MITTSKVINRYGKKYVLAVTQITKFARRRVNSIYRWEKKEQLFHRTAPSAAIDYPRRECNHQ